MVFQISRASFISASQYNTTCNGIKACYSIEKSSSTLFFFPGNRIQGLFFPMENIPNGIYKSVNIKRTFGYPQFFQKNELKQFDLRYHNTVRSKFSLFSFFFWKN